MSDALSNMLADRDWILADGATGTNLFNMGLSSGDAPEMWNVKHPTKSLSYIPWRLMPVAIFS